MVKKIWVEIGRVEQVEVHSAKGRHRRRTVEALCAQVVQYAAPFDASPGQWRVEAQERRLPEIGVGGVGTGQLVLRLSRRGRGAHQLEEIAGDAAILLEIENLVVVEDFHG